MHRTTLINAGPVIGLSRVVGIGIAVCLSLATGFPAAANAQGENVRLELTYPVGKSPRVFTTGWVFGVKCVINPGTDQEKDVSDKVGWSGTAKFTPAVGAVSRPVFRNIGDNRITLSISVDGQVVSKSYDVFAVSPYVGETKILRYARLADHAFCPKDAHGCLACPHPVQGPIISASATVVIDGLGVARVGDTGVHAACCGPNTFKILKGDPNVLIDGKPAARVGDDTEHCGGRGKIIGEPQPYYAVFEITLPVVKEDRKPKQQRGESDDAWARRRVTAYEALQVADFDFQAMPLQQSAMIIKVQDEALDVIPEGRFQKGSRWSVKVGVTGTAPNGGRLSVKGAVLLTVRGTYPDVATLKADQKAIDASKLGQAVVFSDNSKKATVKQQQGTFVIGPFSESWTDKDREDAVRFIKNFLGMFDCFVAHAAYSDPSAPQVQSLRRFRDHVLMRTESGRHLVRLYYEYGPEYALWLRANPQLQPHVRGTLNFVSVITDVAALNHPLAKPFVDELIRRVDAAASLFWKEGASRSYGQFTRDLAPVYWESFRQTP